MVILRLVSTKRGKWCFARMKLVSYLYYPFISNKRQVKRGNCHTLISSGDHLFVGMRPLFFTTSRYLAPIVRQSMKFRDIPEVKRKHCCTIREVPWHAGSQKKALLHNSWSSVTSRKPKKGWLRNP